MAFDQYDTRELFARLIQCEAGGEGENGINTQSYHKIKSLDFIENQDFLNIVIK